MAKAERERIEAELRLAHRVGVVAIGDLQHAEITECLAREVASWKFTTGGDLAVHVNYPLHFRANRAITE